MSFETVKAVFIEARPFNDLGILTPTFKIKRDSAKKVFQEQIDEMYKVPTPEPSPTFKH